MTALVELHIVVAAVLGVLSMLCLVGSLSLGRNDALTWTAAALANGTLQTLVIAFASDRLVEFLSAAVLAPLSFLAASQAMACLGPPLGHRLRTIIAVGALSMAAVGLHLINAPFPVQAAAFELACLVAMIDLVWRVRHHPASGLQTAFKFVAYALLATTAMRLLMLPLHFGPNASFELFKTSLAENLFFGAASVLTPFATILLLARIILETTQTLRHRSERDGLTGLFNRRSMDAKAETTGQGGAVIFCDIDHFKGVNDRYGHGAGDAVICSFAHLLDATGQTAGRIGGEEFAIILPGREADEAAAVAEEVRLQFHQSIHDALPLDERLSASFGVATYGVHEAARHAFERADAALYAAKSGGRNRVVVHGPSAPLPTQRSTDKRRAA